jgi:beta-glucanase (GH16 family)
MFSAPNAMAGWNLTFGDEFNGSSLDTSKWATTYPGGGRSAGGNGEQEYYADNAFSFPPPGTSGYLQINTSQKTQSYSQCLNGTCAYTSGLINTSGKFSQTYGYYEMRTKVPAGKGLWPAFWLLPYPVNYSNEPFEVDIFEIGYANGPFMQGTLHYNNYAGQSYFNNTNNYSDGYHIFAVDWEATYIKIYIDPLPDLSNPVYTVTSNIPSTPAFVLANMAIGGTWSAIGYPDSATITKIANNTVPMDIDYIRVYQKSSSGCYATIPSYSTIPSATCTPTDTTPPAAPKGLSVQ